MNNLIYDFYNRRWRTDGLAGTITACTAHNGSGTFLVIEYGDKNDRMLVPGKIIEVGFIDKGTGKHESNIVYSVNGVAPCVCASFCVKQPPTMILVEDNDG